MLVFVLSSNLRRLRHTQRQQLMKTQEEGYDIHIRRLQNEQNCQHADCGIQNCGEIQFCHQRHLVSGIYV